MVIRGIPCTMMRGGTSKGAYFLARDLPDAPTDRDRTLRAVMGSPDERQIDGIGGSNPLTSKVAIVGPGPPGDPRAIDVAYLFLQVGVEQPTVSDRQNCGNLLAGVGPFAVERGLVEIDPAATRAQVRILMVNTDTVVVARIPVAGGQPVYGGDTAISGVPGTAAAIRLDFEDVVGGSTGALFPSGRSVDVIDGVECTLVDNGMPVVVMAADALDITGHEDCPTLEADGRLRDRLERIRLTAGKLMGLGDVTDTTVPKLTMVAAPRHGGVLSTRTFIPHRCHEAIGVLGAVSVATAAITPGSPAEALASTEATGGHGSATGGLHGRQVTLEHPTGAFDAVISARLDHTGLPVVERATIIRTARKLMDGVVFPRDY